ncbi:hypothetical protein CU098_004925, partial [Rhizopus stolonifer]
HNQKYTSDQQASHHSETKIDLPSSKDVEKLSIPAKDPYYTIWKKYVNQSEKNNNDEGDQKDDRLLPHISKEIPGNAFNGILNVKDDGFCGFRTLALQV